MDEANFIKLKQYIVEHLDQLPNQTDEELVEFIEQTVLSFSNEKFMTALQKINLVKKLFNSFRGLDILQPLLDDKEITEIMINSAEEIFIEKNGRVTQFSGKFESAHKLADLIQTIVSKVNRIVNESSPIVDARLHDGSRVNVVLPPIALKGPTMTIRKFPEKPLTMADLVNRGTISSEVADFLQQLIVSKFNIFISGGTGSGKTTFLNALAQFIPEGERIITIEDSAELQITTVPNLVSLETRNANTELKGEINIRDLIRSSLRMRPNRIIIGEVRGAEALDMLQAMNTGHDGSLSTGHANSNTDMISRLETMVLSGAVLPIQVIRKQIASAIDIMIHLSRIRDGTRRVLEISEVTGVCDGEVQLNPLFSFVEENSSTVQAVRGCLQATNHSLINKSKFHMAGVSAERW